MKKIVLKVNINCLKCKTIVMKAVTKLSGIDEVAIDIAKGTLTVVGDVDPVRLTKQVRKTGTEAEIVSVGPPKPEPSKPKPDGNPVIKPFPAYCNQCQFMPIVYISDDRVPLCVIL